MTLFASINVFAQQFLPVEGIVNARDLGGYEVQGGFSVKTGKLIRAAHLADATDADIAYLESIPVALVLDFRTDMEMKGKADRETIVDDFDATNRVYEKDVKEYSQRVIANGGTEKELAVVKAFLGCNTENFIKALDAVEEQYGSLENYLKGPIGLSEADLETLRGRYLIETNSSNRKNQ